MADTRVKRRMTMRIVGAVAAVLLILGFVWFVRTMMGAKSGKQQRQVQVVQIIQPPPPPPPPPDQPPPPPPEKVEEQLPKDQPEEKPDEEPPPSEPMGLNANGTAGEDAFGLAARHGGSDLVGGGNGGAIFAWYTNRLKDAVLDKLQSDSHIGQKLFSLTVRVWIKPDGSVSQVKLASTTGDRALDQRIEAVLGTLGRLSDAPPLEMPQPVSLKIVSRH